MGRGKPARGRALMNEDMPEAALQAQIHHLQDQLAGVLQTAAMEFLVSKSLREELGVATQELFESKHLWNQLAQAERRSVDPERGLRDVENEDLRCVVEEWLARCAEERSLRTKKPLPTLGSSRRRPKVRNDRPVRKAKSAK